MLFKNKLMLIYSAFILQRVVFILQFHCQKLSSWRYNNRDKYKLAPIMRGFYSFGK